ncbi:MAG: LysR family transcriptional regulator [Rhodospirillaceae bacterium]|nr:LysR family transcriptional regulator [Rhodospirillaceae bacterium]
MDILWFKDLANLSKTGHFSQAAELGNISQPAFSRRIKALETWVGTSLVDRSGHPVVLTNSGQQMLEAGEQAISRIEIEREQILTALAQPDRYVVTFAAQHSIGWRFYSTWLQDFENSFGAILSRLRADDLPNCINDLKEGGVDFVIAYQSEFSLSMAPFPSLESIGIGRDKLLPVCKCTSDGTPLFDLDNASMASIPYLQFGSSAPIGGHIEPLLKASGIREKLSVVYENSMAGALRIRARDGDGVAWLPRSLVQPDIETGLLVIAGQPSWFINLQIRLHRMNTKTNLLTRKIWTFLALREGVSLTSQ